MSRYLFQTSEPVNARALEEILLSLDVNPIFTYITPQKGMIETENNIDNILSEKAFDIHNQLGIFISFLKAPNSGELAMRLLAKSFSYYPNALRYMSDILFKELTFGDYASVPLLYREFASVPKELMGTIGAYLRCGLDGSEAAKMLFIHRNTFLFRLDKFIKLTNIDVRDYHDALLLELYFQLAER